MIKVLLIVARIANWLSLACVAYVLISEGGARLLELIERRKDADDVRDGKYT